jgi:hypothetical protein
MNRILNVKRLWVAVVAGACLFAAVPAFAQVEIVVGPPADFIATAEPVYFEGRPAYWWGGRWYFRDGPGWHYYHDEPAYLRGWRGQHPYPGRVYYGRAHGGGYRRR